MNRSTEIVRVEDLYKLFPIKKGVNVHAVNGVSFSIATGETLGLVGESGSGKTTAGRCLVRLIEPTKGRIFFSGSDVTKFSQKEFNKLRPKAQIVFQQPYDALNPRKKVREIVEDPLILEGRFEKKERLRRVREVLDMVELTEQHLEKYPVQLTQGEQQRIGIARSMATNPQFIVLDEPTSLLDIRFRAEIIHLLKRLQEELGVAYLFITHDLVVIAQLSHRINVMYLGRIVEEGPAQTVLRHPVHPYTRALLSATLFPDPDSKKGEFVMKGEVPSPVNLADNRCSLVQRCSFVKKGCYESLPQLRQVGEDHRAACFEVNFNK